MDAFNRRDFDTALQYMTDDATWAPFLARTETPLLRGKREIRAAWERQFEVMDLHVEVLDVLADENDRVVTWTLIEGRGHGSGLPIQGRYALVFSFRDGLAAAVESYPRITEAMEAAGLSK